MLDEAEIQELVGELPAWLAFRDVERAGWLNKVLAAAWPYLDQATSDVIVAALDSDLAGDAPVLPHHPLVRAVLVRGHPRALRGREGVRDHRGRQSVEIDLQSVSGPGIPDVVLGVRAAQDALR